MNPSTWRDPFLTANKWRDVIFGHVSFALTIVRWSIRVNQHQHRDQTIWQVWPEFESFHSINVASPLSYRKLSMRTESSGDDVEELFDNTKYRCIVNTALLSLLWSINTKKMILSIDRRERMELFIPLTDRKKWSCALPFDLRRHHVKGSDALIIAW